VVPRGPRHAFEFTHSSRLAPAVTAELHTALLRVAVAVPAGVVVFFTSYKVRAPAKPHWPI